MTNETTGQAEQERAFEEWHRRYSDTYGMRSVALRAAHAAGWDAHAAHRDAARWWSDPHDDNPLPDSCVGCLALDPDLTPHQNMAAAYDIGHHYGDANVQALVEECGKHVLPILVGLVIQQEGDARITWRTPAMATKDRLQELLAPFREPTEQREGEGE